MSAAVKLNQVYEYGRPGPRFKVVGLFVNEIVLLEGVKHEAAPPDAEPLRLRSSLPEFTREGSHFHLIEDVADPTEETKGGGA